MFYSVAAATLLVLGAGAFLASRNVARDQVLDDAERQTIRLAKNVIAPLLAPGLAGDTAKIVQLRDAVAERIKDNYITEVTIWELDGRVLFSDDVTAEGTQVDPPAQVVSAIRDGANYAAFEDQPEVRTAGTPTDNEGFVEVYVPLALGTERTLAFEVYYNYDRVNTTANTLLWNILPLVFVPLVLLQIIQVPIAASLARRVRRQEADRARLLEQALSMSEQERVRIAADLHDGPIQDLAGIGYALGAIVPSLPDAHQPLARTVGDTVHHAVDSLRRMMVDIYPPDLSSSELADTVDGLAGPLRDRQIRVDITDLGLPDLDAETITALYRVARESLLNVGSHAQATEVRISLEEVPAPATSSVRGRERGAARSTSGRAVRLVVADNGVGFADGDLDRRSEGHLGLRLLQDRVHSMSGVLTVEAPPTGGTRVTAVLPVQSTLAVLPMR
ncbi:MAG: ATP-binding protein [Nakamurella sp.]